MSEPTRKADPGPAKECPKGYGNLCSSHFIGICIIDYIAGLSEEQLLQLISGDPSGPEELSYEPC